MSCMRVPKQRQTWVLPAVHARHTAARGYPAFQVQQPKMSAGHVFDPTLSVSALDPTPLVLLVKAPRCLSARIVSAGTESHAVHQPFQRASGSGKGAMHRRLVSGGTGLGTPSLGSQTLRRTPAGLDRVHAGRFSGYLPPPRAAISPSHKSTIPGSRGPLLSWNTPLRRTL